MEETKTVRAGRPSGPTGKYRGLDGSPIGVFEFRRLKSRARAGDFDYLTKSVSDDLSLICKVLGRSRVEVVDLALQALRRQILSSIATHGVSKTGHYHHNPLSLTYNSDTTRPTQIKKAEKKKDLSVPETKQ